MVAAVDTLGNDPLAVGRWANSRKTMTTMYDVYRKMSTTDAECSPPPITVHQLIRLYGGNDGVLPAVLDVFLGLAGEVVATAAAMFEFSTRTVATLLSKACPTAVDSCSDPAHPLFVALDAQLTFADWYHFVLMCVREFRIPTAEKHMIESVSSSTQSSNIPIPSG